VKLYLAATLIVQASLLSILTGCDLLGHANSKGASNSSKITPLDATADVEDAPFATDGVAIFHLEKDKIERGRAAAGTFVVSATIRSEHPHQSLHNVTVHIAVSPAEMMLNALTPNAREQIADELVMGWSTEKVGHAVPLTSVLLKASLVDCMVKGRSNCRYEWNEEAKTIAEK
jgi:hypothetical protein